MTTIKIVKNSDRCHVTVNGSPVSTYLFSDYKNDKEGNKMYRALNDAKIQAFNELAYFQNGGTKAVIDTNIETK